MKRKYDLRNKRNILILGLLSIVLIIVFSLFIYKYLHTKVLKYEISGDSILQDVNKNYLVLNDDALLRVRWNDNYYLDYQDKQVNLGKNVIVYNTVTGSLKLYGKFYEITETGKIINNNDETKINNIADAKIYKIGDREYLLVDKQIRSSDRSIETSNYLLVELDKLGNAKLTNNKLNLKTITETTLVTSKYSFDIANEVVYFGNQKIDLKKIIGSTNEYQKDEDIIVKPDDNNQTNVDNNAGNGENTPGGEAGAQNDTPGQNEDPGEEVINVKPVDPLEQVTIEDMKSKVKMTSIVRMQSGLTQIDVDYIVYDPYNEYKRVFVEVEKDGNTEVVNLSKTETHVTIGNLSADKVYKLNFMYTTIDYETGESKNNTFEEVYVRTLKPKYSGRVTGIYPFTSKRLTYEIKLQDGYSINAIDATLVIYVETSDDEGNITVREELIPLNIPVNGKTGVITGSVSIAGYNISINNQEKIIIKSVSSSNGTIYY